MQRDGQISSLTLILLNQVLSIDVTIVSLCIDVTILYRFRYSSDFYDTMFMTVFLLKLHSTVPGT